MIIKKINLIICGLILCFCSLNSSAADQDEPSQKEQAAVAGEAVENNSPDQSEAKDNDSEDEEMAARYDPKHQQYLRGKLAYWFKDYKKAIEEWQPLAEDGIAHAQASLGWMYHNGFGVEQDYQIAYEWYQKSAEQDYAIGQHNLAIMYEHGWGVEQDYKLAREWYEKSATQAYSLSLYNLGLLYKQGLGGDEDRDKAIHLLQQAYQLDVEDAANILKSMGVTVKERKMSSHAPINPSPIEHRPFMLDEIED